MTDKRLRVGGLYRINTSWISTYDCRWKFVTFNEGECVLYLGISSRGFDTRPWHMFLFEDKTVFWRFPPEGEIHMNSWFVEAK